MLLPLHYQYQGQYDHVIRINIDSRRVLTKYIGNYKTQAPVSKQLSPAFVGLLEQVLKKLNTHMSTNTNLQENEFIATLRFGSGDNIKTLKWYGPAIEQDPFLHQVIDLLVSQ